MLQKYYPVILGWVIWTLASAFYCYEYLLRILPSVMTDYLRNLFMMNGLAFGNLAAAYYYTYVPMQIPAGILMDRKNPGKVLAMACLLCAIGAYGFSSSSFYIAYTGRLLIGFGSAFAFVGVMKLATLWFPSHYFSFITGLTTSLGMIGAMIGNMTLVHLIDRIGTYHLLMGAVIIGIVLTALLYYFIPERSVEKSSNADNPMNNRHYQAAIKALVMDSKMWLLGIIGCALFLSLTAFAEVWGIPYLIETYHFTPQQAADYNALIFLGWGIGSPLMGFIASQCNANHLPRFIRVNTILAGICFSLILYAPTLSKAYLMLLLLLFGCFSSVQVTVFTIARNFYRDSISGIAFAVINLIIMLGGGLSQPIIGYLLDRSSILSKADGLIHFSAEGFTYALSILPIAFVVAALLTYCIQSNDSNHHISSRA